LRTKFKSLLYISLMSFTFFIAFLFLSEVFLSYSGVVWIVIALIAFAFGKKDWEYIDANRLTAKDILLSTVSDKFVCVIFMMSLLAIRFIH
ncbi:MAG: hypothetical protein M0023_02385, partial [Desulfobacteraceae bacterium]|nr:hypothetical protein [Desulfobacteraceae bacterium]